MPREIFIVARDRSDLYRYLSQTFSDAENVQVIWDRRGADRRATSNPHIVAGPPPRRPHAPPRRGPRVGPRLRAVRGAFLITNQARASTRGLRSALSGGGRFMRWRSARG